MTYPIPHRRAGRGAFRAAALLVPLLLALLAPSAEAQVHRVRRGDSLARIAKKYRVTVEALREANSLESDDLKVGVRLVVPPRGAKGSAGKGRETGEAPSGEEGKKGKEQEGKGAPKGKGDGGPSSLPAPAVSAPAPSSPASSPARAKAPSPAPSAAQRHKVRKGDSLARIAKKYRVTVEALREANSLRSDDLKVGTRLVVPSRGAAPAVASREGAAEPAKGGGKGKESASAPPARHKVKKGDTLASVAKEHHVSVRELRRMNGLRKSSRLVPGTELMVSRGGGKGRRGPDPEEVDRKMREVAAAPVPGEEMAGAIPLRPDAAKEGSRCANPSGGEALSTAPASTAEASPLAALAGDEAPPSEGWDITGKVLSLAKSMLDVPYRFGGSSFRGIDCSGYVQKVFSYLDIPLPRSAREQFQRGERIEKEQLEKGDLVFFQTYARFPSHVGIYVGDNQFIHASSRDRKVRIDSLDAPYYVKRYIGARRLLDPLPGGAASLESATEPMPGEIPEKERSGDEGS